MSEVTPERRTVRLSISGRVQGVGFRAFTLRAARELGLSGWVRNRRDGTVEALVCGPSDAVEEMLARCRRGPRGSRVTKVLLSAVEGEVEPGFAVLATEE